MVFCAQDNFYCFVLCGQPEMVLLYELLFSSSLHHHSRRSKSLYVLSGYIMQQPGNKTTHRMLRTVWAIESMTFLFQCVKYIPLCQEELLAFIIFCKERLKVQEHQLSFYFNYSYSIFKTAFVSVSTNKTVLHTGV